MLLSSCSQRPKYPLVTADNGVVRVPLRDVNDGRVHFFTFRSRGKNIDFIIRMDGAGKLHACFDACYTCYKKKKGYRQEGTDLICNECGTKFRLAEEVWTDVGGCAPISLPGSINGDEFFLTASDLAKGERLF